MNLMTVIFQSPFEMFYKISTVHKLKDLVVLAVLFIFVAFSFKRIPNLTGFFAVKPLRPVLYSKKDGLFLWLYNKKPR